MILLVLVGFLGCGQPEADVPAPPPVGQVSKLVVRGAGWTVAAAEASVTAALPKMIACWSRAAETPCGTASLTVDGERHGGKTKSSSGTFAGPQSSASVQCMLGVVSEIPKPPKHDPTLGLTVDLVLAPSQAELERCAAAALSGG